MSFFIRKRRTAGKSLVSDRNTNSKQLKRKKGENVRADTVKKKFDPDRQRGPANGALDENISSDSESDVDGRADIVSEEEEETAQEKRIRLAKQYLEEIGHHEREKEESESYNRDAIARRLKEDVLEQAGKLHRKLADQMLQPNNDEVIILHGHKHSITCVAVSSDNKFAYSGSKDCSLIKWDIENRKRVKVLKRKTKDDKNPGHSTHILSLAISTDNKFLVSGGRDNVVHVWNPESMAHIHAFTGHKDAISGLAFQRNTHQLFSASFDRSVKVWNLDEMAYVETLFGHQDSITSIDSLVGNRAITSGGRDTSVRVWKIVEESQLVFNGHSGSIDCVRLINEGHFVSGGDDGNIAVWGTLKKKPLCIVPAAHGSNSNCQSNWISCVVPLPNTDLIASGSSDGHIRFWKCAENFRNMTEKFSLPIVGHVNSMQFASNGSFLVAGVGKEHRFGRWLNFREARNVLIVVPINIQTNTNGEVFK